MFTTAGFCGKVDLIALNDKGAGFLSLEDPVGYAGMEIDISTLRAEQDQEVEATGSSVPGAAEGKTAETFLTDNGIAEGAFLFIRGKLPVGLLENNAYIKVSSAEVDIVPVLESEFGYVEKLMSSDPSIFPGVAPEAM